LATVDAAPVGVFAFIGADGRPRACPVTPYVYAGSAVVSSTLAFTAKVAAVRSDPNVALLAGGWLIRARATVDIDLTSKTFDERLRGQELRKYPPARRLLAIPGHRRLLWWYVGRASIQIPLTDCTIAEGADRVTLTIIGNGQPNILTVDPSADPLTNELPVPTSVEGPACVLFQHALNPMPATACGDIDALAVSALRARMSELSVYTQRTARNFGEAVRHERRRRTAPGRDSGIRQRGVARRVARRA
jgi:hypothetical protein